jgi:hypothetical protein
MLFRNPHVVVGQCEQFTLSMRIHKVYQKQSNPKEADYASAGQLILV